MKRKSLQGDLCPIARTLDAIGDWWSLLIIRDALIGARRFSQFQKNLGVAKNILTVRLHSLVSQGILEVQPASDGSAYQDYVPTAKARALFPVLVAYPEEKFGGFYARCASMSRRWRRESCASSATASEMTLAASTGPPSLASESVRNTSL